MRPSSIWLCRALVLLVGLVVVPASLAAVRPDDKGGQQGTGSVSVVVVKATPNDQAGLVGIGKVSASSAAPSAPAVVEESTGTDWRGILAGGAAVAVVLLVAAAVAEVTRKHGGPAKPVPH